MYEPVGAQPLALDFQLGLCHWKMRKDVGNAKLISIPGRWTSTMGSPRKYR